MAANGPSPNAGGVNPPGDGNADAADLTYFNLSKGLPSPAPQLYGELTATLKPFFFPMLLIALLTTRSNL